MRVTRMVALGMVVMIVLGMAGPANTAIKIKRIAFNPPGADTGSNAHLNREYIVIENMGEKGKNISGWRIQDAGRDHTYRFEDLRLGPGSTVTLQTGRGDDGAVVCSGGCPVMYDFYWDLDNYVWNNDSDRARLIRPNGNVVDSCAYTASANSPVAC